MKAVLVLLAIFAAAAGSFTPGLRVKFAIGLNIGGSFFFKVPTNITLAKEDGWKKTKGPSSPLPSLVMYCYPDKVMCALYDDTEIIAGLQIGIAKAEFSDNMFDWTARGFVSWITTVNGQCKEFWTMRQYFVDEDYLSQSREVRLAAYSSDPDKILRAGAVWVNGNDGERLKVSANETDIIDEGLFTEQACIPLMGTHYYYNMTTSTPCVADQMYPWFPLVKDGELIATGFLTFGQLETVDGERDWFERPGSLVVRAIVPNGPDCLYDAADSPGVVTMHIYYVDSPWTIFC